MFEPNSSREVKSAKIHDLGRSRPRQRRSKKIWLSQWQTSNNLQHYEVSPLYSSIFHIWAGKIYRRVRGFQVEGACPGNSNAQIRRFGLGGLKVVPKQSSLRPQHTSDTVWVKFVKGVDVIDVCELRQYLEETHRSSGTE
eukprot:4230702-Amphidinium_carterae.1